MRLPLYPAFIVLMAACGTDDAINEPASSSEKDFSHYVDPLIGTSRMGHVFPGATAPFGMVH